MTAEIMVWIALALTGRTKTATQTAAKTSTAGPAPATMSSSVSAWFKRVLGVDVAAFDKLTAFRELGGLSTAPRLVSYDRRTHRETTVWNCGHCGSPARIGRGTAVLRRADESGPTEIWIVADDGSSPRRVAPLPDAQAILGAPDDRSLLVGVSTARCTSRDEPYGVVRVNIASGKISDVPGAPCLGSVTLVATGRVRGDDALDRPPPRDVNGIMRPRSIRVSSAHVVTGPSVLFDSKLDSHSDRVDRAEPVWIDADKIVYVANP